MNIDEAVEKARRIAAGDTLNIDVQSVINILVNEIHTLRQPVNEPSNAEPITETA